MDEILVANFMVFHDLVTDEQYDLWIGDEAWELDYFLHENPELKSAAYVWLSDFVGWLPMHDGGEREALLTARLQRRDARADRALPARARPVAVRRRPGGRRARPLRKRSAERSATGPSSTSASPATSPGSIRPRSPTARRCAPSSATATDERVCIVTVGGSGVGEHLLRRVIASFPEAKRLVPELRMIVVAGPADRPADPAERGRARDPRVRPRPVPAPRGVRPGDRPGRADDRRWS